MSLLTLPIVLLLYSAVIARAEHAQTQAAANFCDLLDSTSDTYSTLHYSPSVTSSYFQADSARNSSNTWESGTRDRIRVGIEYDLVNLFRVSTNRKLSNVRCRNREAEAKWRDYQIGSSLKEKLESIKILRLAAEAAVKTLKEGSENLISTEVRYKRKVVSGVATITDLSSISDSIYQVKNTLIERLMEVDKLKGEENDLQAMLSAEEPESSRKLTSDKDSKELMKPVYAGITEEASLKRKEMILDSVSLNLVGGYQRLNDPFMAEPSQGTYLGAELKINLGAILSPLIDSELAATRETSSAFQTEKNKAELLKSQRVTYLKEKARFLSERIDNMVRMMRIAKFDSKTLDQSPAAVRLYANNLIATAAKTAVDIELDHLGGVEARRQVSSNSKEKQVKPYLKTDVVNFRHVQVAKNPGQGKLLFKYNGKMPTPKLLGSGAERYQLGLMLQQENQCNLVYVMLRLGDQNKIAVQEKSNPGQSTHADCKNNGYRTISGKELAPIPLISEGSEHVLSAEIKASQIEVALDGTPVWRGNAPKLIHTGQNIGFRSDNVNVEFIVTDVQ